MLRILKTEGIIQQFFIKGSVFIMDIQDMEQSGASLSRLAGAVDELMKFMQQQKEKFAQELAAQKTENENIHAQNSVLQNKIQTLTEDNEKLKTELADAGNNKQLEEKIKILETEAENRNNKISGLQTEIQNLNTALSNRKTQIEELNKKSEDLTQKLTDAENKIAEFETAAAADNNAAADLQVRLDEALAQNNELSQQCFNSQQKVTEMQQAITKTTENIDDVVARLERVLKENGASDDNN